LILFQNNITLARLRGTVLDDVQEMKCVGAELK
jgi:hypothetical protein